MASIVRRNWAREICCDHCGALIRIGESDVNVFSEEDWMTGGQMPPKFYITCPVSGCKLDTIIDKLPTAVLNRLMNVAVDRRVQ